MGGGAGSGRLCSLERPDVVVVDDGVEVEV